MDKVNLKTFQELARLYGDEKWRFISLVTVDGDIIVPFNNNKTTPENKWKEIKKKFESKLLPEGVYLFRAKNTPGSRGVEDKIFVVKGNLEKMKKEFQNRLSEEQTKPYVPPVAQPLRDQVQTTPAVLTWEAALQNMAKISELTMKNNMLTQQLADKDAKIQELEAELGELEEDDDADGSSMWTWAKEIFPAVDGAFSKWLELEERKIKQRDAALKHYGVPVGNGNGFRRVQTQPADNAKTFEFLKYLNKLISENNMEQLTQEMNVLKTNNPELYRKISEQLVQSGITIEEGEEENAD